MHSSTVLSNTGNPINKIVGWLRNPGSKFLKIVGYWLLFIMILLPMIWHFCMDNDQGCKNSISIFLISNASLFSGGLIGFLFGIPKILQRQNTANGNGDSEYQNNTSLERISDWLTTMIIGVSLTQAAKIIKNFQDLSVSVSKDTSANPIIAGSVILVFFIGGFILIYLWARWYLAISDQAQRNKLNEIAKLKSTEDYNRQPQASTLPAATLWNAESTTPEKWERIPGNVQDDPWKGRFGGVPESKGRKLDATVNPEPGTDFYFVEIKVSSTDTAKPLMDQVRLFLHNSFAPYDKLFIKVDEEGNAKYSIRAYGAFTIGVLADDGNTELELDMAEDTRFPKLFREL